MATFESRRGLPVPDVRVFQPASWALTSYREHRGLEQGRWRPMIALWLPGADLADLLAALKAPAVGEPHPGRVNLADPFPVAPLLFQVQHPVSSDQPPAIRCYLSGLGPDGRPGQAVDDIVAAVDVPAVAATTAALGNHDDGRWRLPILLAAEPAAPQGAPVPPGTAVLALYIDQTPLAEGVADSGQFPEGLLSPPSDAQMAQARDLLDEWNTMARGEAWEAISGVACGHPVSARRVLDLASGIGPALMTGPENTEDENELATGQVLTMILAHVSMLHVLSRTWLAEHGVLDPVRGEPRRRSGRVARSGLLNHVDAGSWAQLARCADDPAQVVELVHTGDPEQVFTTMVAQVAVRLDRVADEPAAYLADRFRPATDIDPAWPLLALSNHIAAHDTVILRSLLSHEEGTRPPFLRGLLHNLHRILSEDPELLWQIGAVLDAEPTNKTPAQAASAAAQARIRRTFLRAVLSATDPCELLEDPDTPYDLVAQGVCMILPLVAEAMIASVPVAEGTPEWVAARDHMLHLLLHTDVDADHRGI